MGAVGNWLLGMQEDAYHLLNVYPQDEARRLFLMQHCSEQRVFEDCLLEWNGEGEPHGHATEAY